MSPDDAGGPTARDATAGGRSERAPRSGESDGEGADGGGLPGLPPPDAEPARLLGVPGSVVARYAVGDVVADAVAAVAPDVIVAAPPDASVVEPSLARVVDAPVVRPGRGMRVTTERTGDVLVAVAPGVDRLPATPRDLAADAPGAAVAGPDATVRQVCLVTDALSLSVDPHRRRTELEGVDAYVETLPDAWLGGRVTHVSTALRPGYVAEHDHPSLARTLRVHGVGDTRAALGVGNDDADVSTAALAVHPNGVVTVDVLDPERYGLRGLHGVGDARAARLREAGYADRESVAAASTGDLADLPGVGHATAARIRASARAVADGTVVPTGDGSLPTGDPVHVDVETDGLSASTAWLVGVLDGDAADGSYLAFREREPGTGDHLEAFATWLAGCASGRPVVAWNGDGFDFPVLREQFRRHCPEYVDAWDDRYTFDPLRWARDRGNAALPGRTNRLDAVAAALGYDRDTRGLDGGTVAELYVAWRDRVATASDPAAVPAPDWGRLEAYCEDDVRALALVYEALREAARRPPETSAPTGADSSQGSLSDFG